MNGRKCLVKHNPPESYGDCIAACVASLIDRDDVPHYFIGDDIETPDALLAAYAKLRDYLRGHGKFLAVFPCEDHIDFMLSNNPNVPYMLWCSTSNGGTHCVICMNGKRIHDPAWYAHEITGPLPQGYYLIGIIGNMIS